jgi:hypothetical protein
MLARVAALLASFDGLVKARSQSNFVSTGMRRRHGNANTNIWMPTLRYATIIIFDHQRH